MHRPSIGIAAQRATDSSGRSILSQSCADAVMGAGGHPILLPFGVDTSSFETIFSSLDAVLLPGGGDVDPAWYGHPRHPRLGRVDRDRDALEIQLARMALRDDIPVLGICRGAQVLAVAGGGTLYQDLPSELNSAIFHDVREYGLDHLCHAIDVQPHTQLSDSLRRSSIRINSRHHQAVRDVPKGFMVAALSDDGVIEAIESPDHAFAVGIQCHPENLWQSTAPEFRGLFQGFCRAASHVKRNKLSA